jgi:hypothetical protein
LHGIMRSQVCSPSGVPTNWHLILIKQRNARRVAAAGQMYYTIWSAEVPPKVRIFAWRLSQECLTAQCNRKQTTLTECYMPVLWHE